MKSAMLGSGLLAIVLVGAWATPARADACNKLTYFRFSEPVALPGVVLPAGTYRFSEADCADTQHVVRVSSRNGSKVYATLLAIPDTRATASNKPILLFEERPSGAPEAIKAWFYPGDTTGDELLYPKQTTTAGPAA